MERTVPDYPPTMVAVPIADGVIQGTSFFPAGYGFNKTAEDNLPEWPEGGVMVVGNDWGTECSFRCARKVGDEATCSTWQGIFKLFRPVFGEDLRDCFFTNAFMGLRAGAGKSTGVCPGRSDSTFKGRCHEFLEMQISAQKPRLILALGKWVPDMLAPLAPRLLRWKNECPTWQSIDEMGPLHEGVRFDGLPGREVVVCALTHPDRPWLNYPRRNYGPYTCELGLLRAAVKAAGLSKA